MSAPTEELDPPGWRPAHRREDERRHRRGWWWAAVLSPIVLLVALVGAWAIDSSAGGVARGVSLRGVDLGGVSEDALRSRIATVAADFAEVPVEIVTPGPTYRTTAGEIGLSIDERPTAEAALAVGDDTFFALRPFEWAASWFRDREIDPQFRVDSTQAAATITELEGDDRVAPVEPSVQLADEGFVVAPGQDGRGLDPRAVAAALPIAAAEADEDAEAITVEVEPAVIPPRGSDEAAQEAAAEATMLTAEPIEVRAGEAIRTVQVDALRSWVQLTSAEDGGVQVSFDRQAVGASLEERFADIESAPRNAGFDVQGGQVVIIPSEAGQVCCADDAADVVVEALRAGQPTVTIDLLTAEPELTTADAEALGIVEEIGSPDAFGPTTQFACCEARVQNIHRIADIVRGQVILPGDTFSVNDFVGQRTREKGFVEAGVIYQGRFQTDVGGGVSQFATTLFNAALFAGLEIPEYQSHSIYISRYPRGHEATINYPNVDLKVRNDTPYGVLLWPEYTDTSITVRLYSTRHAEVLIGEATSSPAGRCTRWTTPRVRVYPDGSRVDDSVSATYRPGEGINC